MAKGFKHGAGGGGAGLNFKIVGNPQPSNPAENTIWVDTDTAITGWAFSATEPDLIDGFVWISVGASSSAEFNALKKNNITVYPISAKQYVSGAWVDKTAKSYQNGEWVDWMMYLYNKGAEYVDPLTGQGWVFSGKYTQNDDSIRVGASGGSAFSGYAESPLLNVSVFDTIEIHIITFNTSGPECYGKLSVIDEGNTTVIEHSLTRGMADDSLVSIDVSSINSRCKFRVTAGHTRTGSGRSSYIDFDVVRCY